MKDREIPECVKNIQHKYSCNAAEYITSIDNEDVYSIYSVDSNGFELPIGLPVFVFVKDIHTCTTIEGKEALELSCKLFTDE